MPEHHLPHEVLVEYAAGASDPGQALVAACHATLCPVCRAKIEQLEALGGALVEELAGELVGEPGQPGQPGEPGQPPGTESAVEALVRATVGAIETEPTGSAATGPAPGSESPAAVPDDPVFPRPLVRVIGTLADLQWRTPYPGVDVFEFELPGAQTNLRVTRVRPGYGVPKHTHVGLEMDLVLTGGLHDRTRDREFERGDIQSADAEVSHELQVLPGEPCIVLTSNVGGIKPIGIKSKLAYRWLGWT